MSLCLDCGLCCDGTLFQRAPVHPEEVAGLEGRLALSVDRSHLMQPCRALDGCRCTVYEQRPSTCRTYRCLLLAAVETGRLQEVEAREALAEVFALRAEVVALNGGSTEPRAALVEARARLAQGTASDALKAALDGLHRAALWLQLPVSVLGR